MKAGIDFGSSLVKAAWMNKGRFMFASTADNSLENIVKLMSNDGVRRVHLAGIGYSDSNAEYFKDFKVMVSEGDAINNEKKLQVKGVKELMKYQKNELNNFILVSVGTGTSYSLKVYGLTVPIPLGNSLSGGFLAGVGRHLGIENYYEMSRMASEGTPLNIYVKDKLPSLEGSVVGEYVVAHLAKADKDSKAEDVLATAIDMISATTIKDLALLSYSSKLFKWTKDVVYIGSTVSGFPALRKSLEKYSGMAGKKPHFPKNGEFALAVGAYHVCE